MTTIETAAGIFEDARRMGDAALERMASGDVRDSAEKAWCATMRATEALVLARTGQQPSSSSAASRRLRTLVRNEQSLNGLQNRYIARQRYLHGNCFYHNNYDLETIDLLIRGTADYVQVCERLAQSLPRA